MGRGQRRGISEIHPGRPGHENNDSHQSSFSLFLLECMVADSGTMVAERPDGEGGGPLGEVSRRHETIRNDQLSPPTSMSPDPSSSVHKVVLTEGTGSVVPLHAICLVRHAGRILSTGDVFVDDSQTSAPDGSGGLTHIVAGRDAVRNNRGLYEVVATMRKGEFCHAWVDASMGYGDKGNFSFPSVPPGADLSYAVELVDFEPPPGHNDTSERSMTYEERLEAAKRRRVLGNEAFALRTAEGSQNALHAYKSSLAFLDDDFMMQLYDFHYDKAMEEKTRVMLNMAACYLRLDKPREAGDVATVVLAHDSKNIKALYRRGISKRILGQTAGALEDLERAKEIAEAGGGRDAGIEREIALVRAELRREDRAQGALYKTIMAKVVARGRNGGVDGRDNDGMGGEREVGGQTTGERVNAADASFQRAQGRDVGKYTSSFLFTLFGFVLALWYAVSTAWKRKVADP